jgi:protease I
MFKQEAAMAGELKGQKIAVLATDGVEQVELTEPVKALKEAGAQVTIVSNKDDQIQGFKHHDKGTKIPVGEITVKVKCGEAVTHWLRR